MSPAGRRLVALVVVVLMQATSVAGEAATEAGAYERALAAYRAGHPADAVDVLEAAVASGAAGPGVQTLLGYSLLRLDRVDEAARAFAAALAAAPDDPDARTGAGYAALRGAADGATDAEAEFRAALELAPDRADAWSGLAYALARRGDRQGERAALRRAAAAAPADAALRARLDANLATPLAERRLRPAVPPDRPLRVTARARDRRFEVPTDAGFRPLWIAGVNLGTALPGRFPAEFPDDPVLYREWFDLMGEMGLNAVRLYTLHPPSLYRALRDHNRESPDRRLWLLQGVWTELPPGDDFDAPDFDREFRREIRRVIDAVHGNLELPPRSGHAGGVYDVDVSGDVLAWLLGREWEPFSVDAYNRSHPGPVDLDGRYVTASGASAIEAWLASVSDETAAHQTSTYRTQAPVGFTSWPTLDPLAHPTEATLAEERAIRGELRPPSADAEREYENDLVQVDATRLRATPAFAAGVYAAYHAYPYYPDFMNLDPGYGAVRDGQGVNRYLGYLQDLAAHHGEQPVLIAELGVPTSRGIAHLHPEGWHHGGHDEFAQGDIDARLMDSVHAAGLAGGVLFAWIDEWFKHNWLVQLYESPRERNPLWHNALDPEQHYGLLGLLAGEGGPPVLLDGRLDDWDAAGATTFAGRGALRRLRVTGDAAYVYLAIELEPGLEPGRLLVGIDTYGRDLGSQRLPGVEAPSAVGLEFLLELGGPDRLLVESTYDLATNALRRPYRSRAGADGGFIEIRTWTNRERYGRDGTRYPALGYSRSPLRRGTTDPRAPEFDSLADVSVDAARGVYEVRLPWGLLNVADPSSRRVIHETTATSGVVQTTATDGFLFHVVALAQDDATVVGDVVPSIDATPWRWDAWERPAWHVRPKAGVPRLVDALRRLTGDNPDTPGASTDAERSETGSDGP